MPRLWTANYTKVWAANYMLYFSFMLLTPLFPLYLRDTFGADKQTIGLVLSGYTVATLLVRPFSGYIVDSFPRKTVLLVCNFFFVALFAGYLAAGSLTAFAIFRTLHGAPFGSTTVAGTTVAIDVLHTSRRSEGIGYYGLSNNLATAISPTIAIWLLHAGLSYDELFILAFFISLLGLVIDATIKLPKTEKRPSPRVLSWDRFFLLSGLLLGLCMLCFSFSYGVISTYVAIYGEEELGIHGGSGIFFMLLATGLALSRLTGARGLRRGRIVENATHGMILSTFGYLLFAALHHPIGFYGAAIIIGLGNGHMYPAFQNMFVALGGNSKRGTANSTLLTSWDLGMGIGVLLGGIIAQQFDYHTAFWAMWIVNAAGVLLFLFRARRDYLRKLSLFGEVKRS